VDGNQKTWGRLAAAPRGEGEEEVIRIGKPIIADSRAAVKCPSQRVALRLVDAQVCV